MGLRVERRKLAANGGAATQGKGDARKSEGRPGDPGHPVLASLQVVGRPLEPEMVASQGFEP